VPRRRSRAGRVQCGGRAAARIRPLSAFARLASGEVVGGAVGRTWGGCCELQQLWVHPAHRRRGLGTRLVRAIEAHARQRGCRLVHLDTFSFQAPDLYRALGYEARLEIAGFAPGVVKYTMVRMLDDEPRAARSAGAKSGPAGVDAHIAVSRRAVPGHARRAASGGPKKDAR
jgi:ribosomal protein S18 acetylase RimI-like enzyme